MSLARNKAYDFDRLRKRLGILSTRIFVYVVAAAYVIFEGLSGLLPSLPKWGPTQWNERVLGVLITVLVVTVIERLFSTASAVEEASADIEGLHEELANVAQNASEKLIQLTNCVDDLSREAERRYPVEEVEIDWLGLELGVAWDYIESTLLRNPKIRIINLRILLISSDWSTQEQAIPAEVEMWRQASGLVVSQIRNWLRDELPDIERQDREVHLTIRSYSQMPTVHGFRVKKPFQCTYFAFCRWEGQDYSRYKWGEKAYRKLAGEMLNPYQKDLIDVFVGYFEYLWRNSDAVPLTQLSMDTK